MLAPKRGRVDLLRGTVDVLGPTYELAELQMAARDSDQAPA